MMGLTNTAGARGVLGPVASTRCLCENARQSQAASWRAASSFPLVNYLPVAPVHEPGCQLVNHVALVQLDSVDTEPMDACNALTAPGGECPALGACGRHLLRRIAGLREHNGEVVGDARAKGERGEPWQRGSQLTAIAAVAGERRAHRAARMN
jgi:hypothetical protein